MLVPRYPVAALAMGMLSYAPAAHGFEKQGQLGAGVGYAALGGTDYESGLALGAHAGYGLSDMFDLRLELAASYHSYPVVEAEVTPATLLLSAGIGPAYKLDVGDWIPYAGILVGYYGFVGNAPSKLGLDTPSDEALGTSVVLGLDFAAWQHAGLGLQARLHGLFDDLSAGFEQTPYFSLFVRGHWLFGR